MSIFCRVTTCILISLIVLGVETGSPQSVSRHDVQAAFIHKFIKFIEWPQSSLPEDSDTILVGIIGMGPMIDALGSIKGKDVRGLSIEVKKIDEVQDVGTCHVLFISPSEEGRYGEILNAAKGAGILTIGQTKGFLRKGVIINFVLVDSKVRFEINQIAGDEAGLKISSKLLNLATNVVR